MAVVDFKNVVKNLKTYNNSSEHTFTLQVKDIYTKVSDPISLKINAPSVQLELSEPGTLFIGQSTETVKVSYNGYDIANNVKLHAVNEYGTWVNCNITNVAEAGSNMYTLTFEVPASNAAMQLKAIYKEVKESNTLSVERLNPVYAIAVSDADAWATSAVIRINPEDTSLKTLMTNYAVVYIKTSTGAYAKTTNVVKDTANGTITVKGLSQSTAYTTKVTLTDGASNSTFSNEVSFITEASTAVPNGDFETLSQTINATINQGGTWTITAGGTGFQTTLGMTVSEPTGWASVNAKTYNASASNTNTWYCIPSTYNTSLSWISHQPTAKVWGIGQSAYDSTADIYKNNTSHSGSNAMVVRSVAWSAAGADVGKHSQTGNTSYSNYYCARVPTISDRSAGKLFLGSYSYSNGQETYNEGVAFTSRPLKLSGYYKYAADSQDVTEKGTVNVQIMNGSTVIGTGIAELSQASDYTQFTVTVNYTRKDLVATQLRIMISSSNSSDIKTTDYCNKEECCSRGAMLTIDNLTFAY
ncbi:MAG: PCMD domain-containing protein [Muribaculaceae bacterium]|nr:PCMD domain-containing protein [Muribaculaceae bacterium]